MTRENIELGIKIVTVAVALFGVWKFFADRADAESLERNSRSLNFIEAYASSELAGARRVLFEFWTDNSAFLENLHANGADERTYSIFARVALREYERSAELQEALFRVANFYDQVWHCRSAKVCEPAVLDTYFCTRASLQSSAYTPFFAELGRSSGYEDFGEGLLQYSQSCSAQ